MFRKLFVFLKSSSKDFKYSMPSYQRSYSDCWKEVFCEGGVGVSSKKIISKVKLKVPRSFPSSFPFQSGHIKSTSSYNSDHLIS